MKTYIYPPQPVSVSVPPLEFIANGSAASVEQDTVNPANNLALPSLQYIIKDGVQYPVAVDTVTPANTISVPVQISGSLGTIGVNVLSSVLPTGAATSANQATEIASLASIDGKTLANGSIVASNTTNVPLGANASFVGGWVDISQYNSISVGLKSDVPSATDGFKFEYSYDGTTVAHTHLYTYSAADGIDYNFTAGFRYGRVNYTNGVTAQGLFQLITVLKVNALFPSSYRLSQPLTDQFSAIITRSEIVGKTTGGGGGYVDVKVNPSGALAADVTGTVSVSNFPATQPVSGSVSVSNFPATQAVSAVSLPLPTGASTLAEQQTQTTAIGSLTEAAPATDTASSGLNGRLQRIAQRLTSLIALFPTSLGAKLSADSLSVVLASDQAALPITQGGLTPSYQEVVNLTTAAQTVTPPANAKWVKIYAEDTNVANIRVRLAGTATTTSGIQFQPGRSEDFSAVGTAISIIAESGTNQKINFTFGT